MRVASKKAAFLVAVLWLSTGSCRGEAPHDLPSDVLWTSSHFSLHARAQDQNVCADALDTLEQHFALLQGMFGLAWPAGRTIHYYKFVDHADFLANAPCPEGSGACADQSDVYSDEVLQQHELVHSYLWPFGTPPALVTEGTAVALACNRTIPETPSLSLAEALLVQDPLRDQHVYDTGGRLVRYLLDQYGPELFIRFYVSLGKHAGIDELDQALRDVFGSGADDIWAAALATPAGCLPAFACSRQALPLDGTMVPLSPVCGVPSVDRTFSLASPGGVAIWGPPSTSVASCDSTSFSALSATKPGRDDAEVGLLTLPAGRYYVEVPVSAATKVAILAASRPWAGPDCSALQPFVVALGQYPNIAVSIPSGISEWGMRLSFAEPHLLRLIPGDSVPSEKLSLTVCRDCDFTSPSCQTYDMSSGAKDVLWQGDYILRVQTAERVDVTRLDIVRR